MIRKKKDTPFLQLSTHRKKKQYIQIKNSIRSDHLSTGFYFHTIDCLDEKYKATWSDIYFLSKKYKDIFYNATIDVAQNKLISMAEDAVQNDWMSAILPYKDDLFSMKSVCDSDSLHRLDFSAWEVKHDDLKGLTVNEYHDYLVDAYLEKEKPPVFQEFKLYDDFAFGVGLDIIVDEEYITYEIVDKYVQLFYAKGEVDWKSDIPVASERLIYKHDWYVGKGVSLSNAIKL